MTKPIPVVQWGNSQQVRDFVWNWMHRNVRDGYTTGLRVRARSDIGGMKIWTDYKYQEVLEFFVPYYSDLEEHLEVIKATYALIGEGNVVRAG